MIGVDGVGYTHFDILGFEALVGIRKYHFLQAKDRWSRWEPHIFMRNILYRTTLAPVDLAYLFVDAPASLPLVLFSHNNERPRSSYDVHFSEQIRIFASCILLPLSTNFHLHRYMAPWQSLFRKNCVNDNIYSNCSLGTSPN